jgi:hypothetical protein
MNAMTAADRYGPCNTAAYCVPVRTYRYDQRAPHAPAGRNRDMAGTRRMTRARAAASTSQGNDKGERSSAPQKRGRKRSSASSASSAVAAPPTTKARDGSSAAAAVLPAVATAAAVRRRSSGAVSLRSLSPISAAGSSRDSRVIPDGEFDFDATGDTALQLDDEDLGLGSIGRPVVKTFEGVGKCHGTIIAVDLEGCPLPVYRVRYEDGDEEDVAEQDVRAIIVVRGERGAMPRMSDASKRSSLRPRHSSSSSLGQFSELAATDESSLVTESDTSGSDNSDFTDMSGVSTAGSAAGGVTEEGTGAGGQSKQGKKTRRPRKRISKKAAAEAEAKRQKELQRFIQSQKRYFSALDTVTLDEGSESE